MYPASPGPYHTGLTAIPGLQDHPPRLRKLVIPTLPSWEFPEIVPRFWPQIPVSKVAALASISGLRSSPRATRYHYSGDKYISFHSSWIQCETVFVHYYSVPCLWTLLKDTSFLCSLFQRTLLLSSGKSIGKLYMKRKVNNWVCVCVCVRVTRLSDLVAPEPFFDFLFRFGMRWSKRILIHRY